MTVNRPPYLAAAGASLLVLMGYLATLAPTVTFWDAGEFIAAAKTLGIPHPPGTPLFVMLGHVWGALVPFGEYAARLNLLSALMSALGAGCFFLVAHESLVRATTDLEGGLAGVIRIGGGLAAALISGFTFTNWQNSNETEVYGVAMFTVAAIACWACAGGRRGDLAGGHLLLLMLYLAGWRSAITSWRSSQGQPWLPRATLLHDRREASAPAGMGADGGGGGPPC
jgi:hypothetical protein